MKWVELGLSINLDPAQSCDDFNWITLLFIKGDVNMALLLVGFHDLVDRVVECLVQPMEGDWAFSVVWLKRRRKETKFLLTNLPSGR